MTESSSMTVLPEEDGTTQSLSSIDNSLHSTAGAVVSKISSMPPELAVAVVFPAAAFCPRFTSIVFNSERASNFV